MRWSAIFHGFITLQFRYFHKRRGISNCTPISRCVGSAHIQVHCNKSTEREWDGQITVGAQKKYTLDARGKSYTSFSSVDTDKFTISLNIRTLMNQRALA